MIKSSIDKAMKAAVRTRLGLQPPLQGLLSKSALLSTTLRASVFTLNSEGEHTVQFSGLSFPKKNSPQMTIINYLLFNAIEYISK